jgi:adenylyltransferase/sulfurtransferase
MDFAPQEIERYARHLVLAGVGGPGQQKLKKARLLVVGAGGLGTPVIQYAAAAGIGAIGIVDDDRVSLSNLQRQVIHDTAAVGTPKVESAAASVKRLNPHVVVEVHDTRLNETNAAKLVGAYDIVADCSDGVKTRYLLSDACFYAGKTLVTAAVGAFDGSLTTLKPHLNDANGRPNPTYRCLFPDPPPEDMLPVCSQVGVLGALVGVLGTLQALEVIKEIVGIGERMVGRLLLFDARDIRFETVHYAWNPRNPLNGRSSSPSMGTPDAPQPTSMVASAS